ncbi:MULTISPECIES: hypothetical protein [unclassified Nocardioides]|uniref:hypothetical protein n=1 Tax=unclassified Nocardioides TaxID=2615069 RepID=UPI00360EA7EC
MPSNHRSIQDSATTLPLAGGDRDFEVEFDAPDLSGTTSTHARPYLSYRANPGSNAGVRLMIELNGTEIVDQTLSTTASRTLTEIFEHGVLREDDNELRVFVPNNEPGSVTISDLVVTYSAA